MRETYAFKLDWYNESTDQPENIKGFVFGESYEDAVGELSSRFPYFSNLYINLMPEGNGFVFVDDEEIFDELLKNNDDAM